MMATPPLESHLKKDVDKFLKHQMQSGVLWYVKIHGSGWQRAGVPDFLLNVMGLFCAIELKRPGWRLGVRPAQERQIEFINRSHGNTAVCDSLEDVQAVVARLMDVAQAVRDAGLDVQAFRFVVPKQGPRVKAPKEQQDLRLRTAFIGEHSPGKPSRPKRS